MSTLVLRFSGRRPPTPTFERLGLPEAHVDVASRDLGPGSDLWRARPRHEALALLGEPPEAEIGYWLAAAVALATGPRRVASLDVGAETARVASLQRFLASQLPFAAAQLVASAAALAGQRAALATLGSPDEPRRPPAAPSGSRAVYLRPAVGAGVGVGGSITHTHEVIRALGSLGTEVDAVTTDRWIAATAAREARPPCTWRLVESPRVLRALPATLAFGGDLALVRAAAEPARGASFIYQRHARFSLCGALLARVSGRPLFLEYNGSEAWIRRNWGRSQVEQRLLACEEAVLACADRVIVVSQVDRQELTERGVDPRRIVLNPNGVDASRFACGGGEEVRKRLGIAPDAMVFGFVGTFGPWHGAPVLARAFARLAEEEPTAQLLLVGDGEEQSVVREIVAEARCEDRTHFVGAVDPDAVPARLDACDVLVSPHVWESDGREFFGSPTKVFEYMAAAKPIVASALGQIAQVLEDGRSAVLVPPGDVDALRAAMARLGSDAELRARLGLQAREHALSRHSWRANGERVLKAYEELTARPALAESRASGRSRSAPVAPNGAPATREVHAP